MPQANAVSVKSINGSTFTVRIRPRGVPTYESLANRRGTFLADLLGELLHYTVFRRRWWVEAFKPPRPLRSRYRWAETETSESTARERMQILVASIESGTWLPGDAATPPPSVPSRNSCAPDSGVTRLS